MHNPACSSWSEHVEKAYAAIHDEDEYDLRAFVDFLQHSWDNERLAADPEFPPMPERRDWPLKWDAIKKAKGVA